MPFPLITTPYARHVNTLAADTIALKGTPSKADPRCKRSGITEALSNVKLRLWPDALERAAAPLLGASAEQVSTDRSLTTPHSLQAYMDDFNRHQEQIAAMRLDPRNADVRQAFFLCHDALQTVVTCRTALDAHHATDASPEQKRDAKLESASKYAAVCIAQLRHAVRARLRMDPFFDTARALLYAATVGAAILLLAFPPAGLAIACVMVGGAAGFMAMSLAKDVWTPRQVRSELREMDRLMRDQPSELDAAERRLSARIATMAMAANAQATAR